MFRPRTKSDTKKKDKDGTKAFGSDRDNSSGSGSAHSGSGGIMHSMKTAVQNTIGHKHTPAAGTPTTAAAPKFRDGSAHPHAGSDAQVSFGCFLLVLLMFITFVCFFCRVHSIIIR